MNRVDTMYKTNVVSDELKASMQIGGAGAKLLAAKNKKKKDQERFKDKAAGRQNLKQFRDSFKTDVDWNENVMGDLKDLAMP